MMTNKEYVDEVRKLRSEKHLAELEIRDKLKDYPESHESDAVQPE